MTVPYEEGPGVLDGAIDPSPFVHIKEVLSDSRIWQTDEFSEGARLLDARNPVYFESHRGFYAEKTPDELPPTLADLPDLLDEGTPKDSLMFYGTKKAYNFYTVIIPLRLADAVLAKRERRRAEIEEVFRDIGVSSVVSCSDPEFMEDAARPQTQTGLILRVSMDNDIRLDRLGADWGGSKPQLPIDVRLQELLDDSERSLRLVGKLFTGIAEILS